MQGIKRREFLGLLAAPLARPAFWNPRKYLLLDPRTVERVEGAKLQIGAVRKEERNPLFGEDRPWEVKFDNLYPNVIHDREEGIYKLWYDPFLHYRQYEETPRALRPQVDYAKLERGEPEMGVCYATSRDGIVWEKPSLGLIEYNGSRQNNIVARRLPEPSGWNPHGIGVIKDARDPDPARRYKMFMSYPRRHMCVSFSADGLRWSEPVACPEIAVRGDTHNNAFWAPSLGKYVGITRDFDAKEKSRLVCRTESEDFIHWTNRVEVMRHLAAEPQRQTYAMVAFPYANLYLGLLMMLNRGENIERSDPRNDTVDCELAWSADTVRWERVAPGVPLIPRGPAGIYDSGCLYAAAYPVVNGREMRLYYGGNNGKHSDWRDGFFCLAHMRADGFAGMDVRDSGRIETRPVPWRSSGLRITADARHGSIAVKALDGERVIGESHPLTGDVTDEELRWKRAVPAAMDGKPVRLRFEVRSATMYSFVL